MSVAREERWGTPPINHNYVSGWSGSRNEDKCSRGRSVAPRTEPDRRTLSVMKRKRDSSRLRGPEDGTCSVELFRRRDNIPNRSYPVYSSSLSSTSSTSPIGPAFVSRICVSLNSKVLMLRTRRTNLEVLTPVCSTATSDKSPRSNLVPHRLRGLFEFLQWENRPAYNETAAECGTNCSVDRKRTGKIATVRETRAKVSPSFPEASLRFPSSLSLPFFRTLGETHSKKLTTSSDGRQFHRLGFSNLRVPYLAIETNRAARRAASSVNPLGILGNVGNPRTRMYGRSFFHLLHLRSNRWENDDYEALDLFGSAPTWYSWNLTLDA